MVTCGIDAGIKYTKVVIMKNGEIIGKAFGQTGGAKRKENINNILNMAVAEAGLNISDIGSIGITGKAKYNTGLKGTLMTEIQALQKAAEFLEPEATEVVSIGADETLAFVLENKRITEYALNQKCVAGLGLYLENLIAEFGIDPDRIDMNKFDDSITVNDGCIPFCRMDVLELLNKGVSREEIMMSVMKAVSSRISSVINDVTIPNEKYIIVCGGLAEYQNITELLKKITKKELKVVENPMFFGAIGAAWVSL